MRSRVARNGAAPAKGAYPYQLVEVAPGVWPLPLSWSRAYVLTDGRGFSMVDNGTVHDRALLLAGLRALGLEPANCRQVIQTHGHCDHAGNAAFLAEEGGAALVAHELEVPFLATRRTYIPRGIRALGPRGLVFGVGELRYPVQRHAISAVVCDGDSIDTPAGVCRVVHTPGHTPGHIALWRAEDRVLLCGDALLNFQPYKRREGLALSPFVFNSDNRAARRSVQRLAELQVRVLLSGHGRSLTVDTAERIDEFAASL